MSYLTEFPNIGDMPAIPASWLDISWKNDICPHFEVRKFGTASLSVWADSADKEQREFPEWSRYTVCLDSEKHGESISLLDTDDFAAVLDFCARMDTSTALAAVICEQLKELLSAAELTVIRESQENGGRTHADDFCDLPQVMVDSLAYFGMQVDGESEEITSLTDEAFAMAEIAGFDTEFLF